jgi:hypothetical protein
VSRPRRRDDHDVTELTERDDGTLSRIARCDHCGIDLHDFRDRELPAAIRAMGERWVVFADAVAGRPGADEVLRTRPHPGQWSPVELGCHVRDGIDLGAARLERMLTEDRPRFASWDYAASLRDGEYREQNLYDVAADIAVNADHFASLMAHVRREAWTRVAIVQDRQFTVTGLARFLLHEGHHHLLEAEGLPVIAGTR